MATLLFLVLFSLCIFVLVIVKGAVNSLESFNSEGLSNRYLAIGNSAVYLNFYDNPEIIKAVEEAQKEQIKQKPAGPNGRPANKKDSGPRKQRVAKPKSKPGVAKVVTMAQIAYDKISNLLNNAILESSGKENLRQLTKAQLDDLENLKLIAFSNIDIANEITDESIVNSLKKEVIPESFSALLKSYGISYSNMPINDYKKALVGVYVEHYTL